MPKRRDRSSSAQSAYAPRGTKIIYFNDVAEYVSAARACGLPAEQFVDVARLRRDLEQFGVL